MPRAVLTLIVLCATLVVYSARAEPSRVRVVQATDADPAMREATLRLQAELVADGFVVDMEETPATDPRGELESGSSQSFASIAILRSGSQTVIDVWVVDHLTGKTSIRRVDAGATPGPTPARTLAIRAVELLRASLLEATLRPQEQVEAFSEQRTVPTDVARWMQTTAPPRRPFDGWSLELGAATSVTTGYGPTIGPLASVSGAVAAGWFLGVRWVGPTWAPALRSPVASADVRQMMALGEIRFEYGAARFGPLITLGLGVADTLATGQAAPPLQTHDVHGLSAAVHGSIGLHLRLAKRVGLVVDTGALVLSPARPIRILGDEVGNTSAVSWLSSLGLVASFD